MLSSHSAIITQENSQEKLPVAVLKNRKNEKKKKGTKINWNSSCHNYDKYIYVITEIFFNVCTLFGGPFCTVGNSFDHMCIEQIYVYK